MSPSADLHDVWRSGVPLGVACNHCLHRALLQCETIGAHEGNVKPVDQLRLRCRKCGRRDYETVIFLDRRGAKKFMAEYR